MTPSPAAFLARLSLRVGPLCALPVREPAAGAIDAG